jgi:hypothetical protein
MKTALIIGFPTVVLLVVLLYISPNPVFMPFHGSPHLDCIGAERSTCEDLLRRQVREADGPVTYFRFTRTSQDPLYGGLCGDSRIIWVRDTFGPFGWFAWTQTRDDVGGFC